MECMQNRFRAGTLLDNRYETLHELNHGSFGLVFKAKDTVENKFVALKCLTKPKQPTSVVDDAKVELAIHKQIGSHPNVVELVRHFETPNHIYLVLEFCSNGDLFEAIHAERGPRQTEKVREMMLQLVDAVDHMHSRGVFHRDIKPENIFLSDSGSVKLGDFGLATTDVNCYETAVGSDRYMAPEQYDAPYTGYSPARADVWAVGVCLLNILFGKNPFNTPTEDDRCFSDFVRDRSSLFDIFDKMSQDTYNVLVHCLAIDPESRSLEAARRAIMDVEYFTTDDESTEDDFLMNSPPKAITANREPLRTPSISSPQVEAGGAFPWQRALAINLPAGRQLSAIPDEDIFPIEAYSSKPIVPEPPASAHTDNASLVSFVDSGLGVSLKSSFVSLDHTKMLRVEPMTISSPLSLPTRGGSLAAIFGQKKPFESKSWSEMIEDDDDDDFDIDVKRVSLISSDDGFDNVVTKPAEPVRAVDVLSSGSDTPRTALAVPQENSQVVTPMKSEEHLGMFDFEQHTDSGSTATTVKWDKPSTARRLFDKWQALGDRRRGNAGAPPSPEGGPVGAFEEKVDNSPMSVAQDSSASTNKTSTTPWNMRYRVGNWRKPRDWNVWGQGQQRWNASAMNFGDMKDRRNNISSWIPPPQHDGNEWIRSTDWRKH